jgi:rhodanese-related sulfurtransferase
MPADDLRRTHAVGAAPAIIDLRPPDAFAKGHVQGAVNIPETRTTALMQTLGRLGAAVLVCDDGRLSAAVCRTVGFCGLAQVFYLDGGLRAWEEVGGPCCEIDAGGKERRAGRFEDEPSTVMKVAQSFSFRNLVLGLAGAVGVVAVALILLLR